MPSTLFFEGDHPDFIATCDADYCMAEKAITNDNVTMRQNLDKEVKARRERGMHELHYMQ